MQKEKENKTYSTRDSLVVTHPTTSLAVTIRGLSMGERTGSRVFHHLWRYVLVTPCAVDYIGNTGWILQEKGGLRTIGLSELDMCE